jgi:hypothetical protein
MKVSTVGVMGRMGFVACLALATAGCGFYPYGVIYDGTTTPHGMMRVNGDGTNKTGSKHGETCATGILGLIAWGDASVASAKEAGGIKEVHSVEYRDFNVLFIYHQGCTVVHGE